MGVSARRKGSGRMRMSETRRPSSISTRSLTRMRPSTSLLRRRIEQASRCRTQIALLHPQASARLQSAAHCTCPASPSALAGGNSKSTPDHLPAVCVSAPPAAQHSPAFHRVDGLAVQPGAHGLPGRCTGMRLCPEAMILRSSGLSSTASCATMKTCAWSRKGSVTVVVYAQNVVKQQMSLAGPTQAAAARTNHWDMLHPGRACT